MYINIYIYINKYIYINMYIKQMGLQTPQTLPQAFPWQLATTTLADTCPSHLFSRAFQPAVCPPANASNRPAGLSEKPLNTDAFKHKRLYTQMLLHTDTFTHRHFYTQMP